MITYVCLPLCQNQQMNAFYYKIVNEKKHKHILSTCKAKLLIFNF